MANKKFLTQLEILINSTLGTPESGYLGFGAKSDGFYMKTPTGEHLLLTSQNVLNIVNPIGSASHDYLVTELATRKAIEEAIENVQPIRINEESILGRGPNAGVGPPVEIKLGYGLGFDIFGRLTVTASGGGGSGTVTSVALSMPNIFSVSGSPITTSGTLTATLVSQIKNRVFAAPFSANGVPTFRALVAEDLPDLSGMFDFYGSWNMQINAGTTKLITKTDTQQYGNMYNGIKLIAGSNVTLSESNAADGALAITISAAAGGDGGLNYTQMTLISSPAPISAGVWTDVPTMSISTWGDGAYLVIAHVSMAKSNTGASSVAMQIVTNANDAIASGEQYITSASNNRATISLSSVFMVTNKDPASVRMRIHSNATGWSAIATTLNSQSQKATQITLIKIL